MADTQSRIPVPPTTREFCVEITSLHGDFEAALRCALNDATLTARAVKLFVSEQVKRGARLDRALVFYFNQQICSAVVSVESPGGSALILAPIGPQQIEHTANWVRGTAQLLHMLFASSPRVVLHQLLIPENAISLTEAARASGMRFLTSLLYLERDLQCMLPDRRRELTGLTILPFRAERQAQFEEALAASYVQSLDCPELSNLRTPSQILAGHRAIGDFHPSMWLLALCGGMPAGILLMSRLSPRGIVEVVYLGLAQSVRGKGVADELLWSGIRAAKALGATRLALAVDARNDPAKVFYDRWEFEKSGHRDAWVQVLEQ